jgi:uncharacterized protein involved in exopolysaccharide biosynthesis
MQPESRQDANSPIRSSRIFDRRRFAQSTEDEDISILEYWSIFRRRFNLFLLAAIVFFLAVFIYVLNIPATYRSEATILIEDHELPEDIVGATMTNYAYQQIQLISQRLFTIANIRSIVERFDIYQPMGAEGDVPDTLLAKRFRLDMELDMVSAEILDRRGQTGEAAVAFTLAFNSPDPEMARKVTQELVALFLNENQRTSSMRSSEVSELLRTSVNDANEDLLESEAELAEFKAKNEGALPELHQLNLNVINRTEQQLSDLNLRLQELQQRKLQLSVQLSALSPSAPVTLASGETVMGDKDRMQALMVDYRRKSAIYQAGHPDLVRLEREIEILQRTVGGTETYALIQEQLRQERNNLRALRDRYSDDHPDIKSSEAAIRKLESQLAATDPRDTTQVGVADNPAYILIKTQLQAVDLEVASQLQKRRELQASVAEYEALIKRAPQVEMQYEALLRTYNNAKAKHADLQAKLRAAEVAADMEQGITGQRFTLIEPPFLPIDPEPRYRLAMMFLGCLLAGAVGVGAIVVAELVDQSIRSPKVLSSIVGAPPLAVIPYLDNSADIAHARNQRVLLIAAFLAGAVLSIAYVIYFL